MAEMAEKSTVILVNAIRESRRKRQKKKKKKKKPSCMEEESIECFFFSTVDFIATKRHSCVSFLSPVD